MRLAVALGAALALALAARGADATASLKIVVFATTNSYTGSSIGATRASTTAKCVADPVYTTLACHNASMLIAYSGDTNFAATVLPGTSVPLSATNPVLGPTGITIATNWAAFWSGAAWTNTLQTAQVSHYSGGFTGVDYYTGIDGNSAYASCILITTYWTSNLGSDYAIVVHDNDLGGFWTGDEDTCSSSLHGLCTCLTAATFPTPAPTPPTASPTTHTPSRTPSQAPVLVSHYYIYLYMPPSFVLSTQVPNACPSASPTATGFQCKWTWPIAATSGYTISNPIVPGVNVGFSSTKPVLSMSYVQIAANWPTLWSSGAAVSLIAAGVTPYSVAFWTGLNPDGTTAANTCSYWTTSSPSSTATEGESGLTGTRWINDGYAPVPCNANVLNVVCACLSPLVPPTSSPSKSPSKAPTHRPSHSPSRSPSRAPSRTPSRTPTTSKPSAHPSRAPSFAPSWAPTLDYHKLTPLLFLTTNAYTGSQIGATRAASDAICASDPAGGSLSCRAKWMVVSHASDAVPYTQCVIPSTSLGFSCSTPVFSPQGTKIAANWSELWRVGPRVTLASAGLGGTPQFTWSGIRATGSAVGGIPNPLVWQTCNEWTSSSPVQQGIVGTTGSTTWQWYNTPFGAAITTCDHAYRAVCACLSTVPATTSPTSAPTRPSAPHSARPTRHPTSQSPTTKSPTLLPTTASPTPPTPPTPPTTQKPTPSPSLAPTSVSTDLNITLYVTSVAWGAPTPAPQRTRAGVNAFCVANRPADLYCEYSWALLFFSHEVVPVTGELLITTPLVVGTLVEFSATMPVMNNDGSLKIANNWNALWYDPLLRPLNPTLTTRVSQWTGVRSPPEFSDYTYNCDDWTFPPSFNMNSAPLSNTFTTYAEGWYSAGSSYCNPPSPAPTPMFPLMCGCLLQFAPVPTLSPTKSPHTASPTFSIPTRPARRRRRRPGPPLRARACRLRCRRTRPRWRRRGPASRPPCIPSRQTNWAWCCTACPGGTSTRWARRAPPSTTHASPTALHAGHCSARTFGT